MNQQQKRGFGRKALLGSALGLGGLALAGCEPAGGGGDSLITKALAFGWPTGITPEAQHVYSFWTWVWVVAWTIGFIMWGLFIYAMFAWSAKKAKKKGKGEFPRQTQYNIPLELVLTIVPVFIVLTLFFFTVQAQEKVTALDKDPKVTVDVTAFQWNWKFGYNNIKPELSPTGQEINGIDQERQAQAEKSKQVLGPDGQPVKGGANPIHGRSLTDNSYLHFDQIETLGTSDVIPVLVLPSNTAIEFNMASADVSHAFWVPEFLFKRDVIAHPDENKQERRYQVSEITEEGAFVGRCTEMCGTYHAMMNFELRVVSPEKFKKYIEYRTANPEAPNSDALKAIGEQPYAVTTEPFSSERATNSEDNMVDNGVNTVKTNDKSAA